mgnify:FL=1
MKHAEMSFDLPYYDTPTNDNQRLLNLQLKYKVNGGKYLGEMYKLLYEIAYKTINKLSEQSQKIKNMDAAERMEKAHNAATYIVEQYLKRPDFAIKNSMTGYLFKRVQYELYGKNTRHCDKMLIFYGDVPASKEAKKKFYYIVKDNDTGKSETFESFEEMHLDPRYKTLRKKRFVDGIRYGKTWKNYSFDILEVNE